MGEPIRILHVVVNMNRGGAETLLMNLYRNIDRSRIQFDFLTCKDGVFDAEIRELGGIVHQIPYVSEVGHFAYIKALDQFFAVHWKYQVVHSHMDKMSGLVLSAAKRAGIPIRIAHSHNTCSEGGVAAKMYKLVAGAQILPNATNLMACSETAAAWLYKDQAKASHILKNGIDIEAFSFSPKMRMEAREELGVAADTLVVGHIGRFNEQKNHSHLLDIFSEIARLRSDSKLILVGDGPLREKMKDKASRLHLSTNVKFLGIRSDVNRLLQAMDVIVFPSLHEGLPVTLIEAQVAGIPCIVSKNITREADMGLGLLEFKSLQTSPMEWAKSVVEKDSARVKHTAEKIRESGFDIRENTKWLEQFYIKHFQEIRIGAGCE